METDIMQRSTISEIVGYRNKALALWVDAFRAIETADQAIRQARSVVQQATGGLGDLGHIAERDAPEVAEFNHAVRLPDADQYARVAKRLTDIEIWSSIIARTDLEHLMDKTAKDELREQMRYIPERVDSRTGALINGDEISKGLPEITEETIEATLRHFAEDSQTIFRRGVAVAFSALDRRFKSHDGFKLGARVVLSGAFSEWGGWNHHRAHRDTLTDIERVFLILDGKGPRANYAGIVGKLDAERRGISQGQSEHEGDYFRVRVFKNGNAHLWFTRKDLLAEVNKILAEWYGATVGDGVDNESTRGGRDPLDPDRARDRMPARNLGFYPTPDAVADRVLEQVHFGEGMRVLEPSAGNGALAYRVHRLGCVVDTIELDPDRSATLRRAGVYSRTVTRDFLTVTPDALPQYDRVVMNPPFDRGRDIDHVSHALKFLKPGGTLLAIMAAGVECKDDARSKAFRKLVGAADDCSYRREAQFFDLPACSFSEFGTNVNTVYLIAHKRGE